MKKVFIISVLLIATGFSFTGCKSEVKKDENKPVTKETKVVSKKSLAPFAVSNATNDMCSTCCRSF